MNWAAMVAVAEITGAVGVIASLVYLAIQVRQNTRWLRSSVIESAGFRSSELARNVAVDPELSRLVRAAMSDATFLNEEERWRFRLYLHSAIRNYEISYSHHRDGLLAPQHFAGLCENLRLWVGSPLFEAWWKVSESMFDSGFAELVNELSQKPSLNWNFGEPKDSTNAAMKVEN